jgi:Fe2+ or Zn2+ uptake regulation protein
MLGRFQRDGLPKYTALRDAIVSAVAGGQLAPGDRVPNEQELAAALPISLGTIQRALRQLVEEGVIQRRHGQGSFISGRRADGEMSQPFHCRFLNDDGTGYLPVFPETQQREAAGEGEWNRWLGKGPLVEITRNIRIGDEFDVFSSFVVDGKRLPVFSTQPLRKLNGENFKDLIFRACGQAIQKVDVYMNQRVPPADVSIR